MAAIRGHGTRRPPRSYEKQCVRQRHPARAHSDEEKSTITISKALLFLKFSLVISRIQ